MNANISSFKLKRGYMATFAEFETGNGQSRNYVAADGDMEISVLPAALGSPPSLSIAAWAQHVAEGMIRAG